MHGAGDRGGDNTRANGCSARRTLIPMLLGSPRNLIGTLQGWIRCAANGDVSNAGYSVLLWCNTCCVGVTMYAKDDPNVSGITKNGAGYPVRAGCANPRVRIPVNMGSAARRVSIPVAQVVNL